MEIVKIQSLETTKTSKFVWLAAFIAIIASFAYAVLGDWPLGTHPDEAKKAFFVLSGEQDFKHPILMIQVGRLANLFANHTDILNFINLARDLSAVFGGFLVFSTFILGRVVRLLPLTAIAITVAVAVCPLVVVHATFFKEDIFLGPPLVLGIATLIWVTDRPNSGRSLVLGCAIGFAISAKYIGAVLLPLSLIFILTVANGSWRERFRAIAIVTGITIATFVIINWPLLYDLDVFQDGFTYETTHALTGHLDMVLGPDVTLGVMQLTNSLAPGLGISLLVIGLAGLIVPIVDRERRRPLVIIVTVTLVWYAVHEISPMKPYGIERYMVPLAPLLLVLGAGLLEKIVQYISATRGTLITPFVLIIASMPALFSTFQILGPPNFDPRSVIQLVASDLGPGVRPHLFAAFNKKTVMTAALGPNRKSEQMDTVIFSSLVTDRYLRYGERLVLDQLSGKLRSSLQFIEQALPEGDWPYLVITNGRPSFSYLNRDLYIFAIDKNIDRLNRIKLAIEVASPPDHELSLTLYSES